MKKILITGIRGFVGSHLTRYLLETGHEVSGIDRKGIGPERMRDVFQSQGTPASLSDKIRIYHAELENITEIESVFKESSFDGVIHLAGSAFVPESWKDPASVLKNNTLSTVSLLQGARSAGWKGKFLFVSTSDVYGNVPEKMLPISEETPAIPNSPYATSKLAAEQFAGYFCMDGIGVIIARPFNHFGPGQKRSFVIPAFLERIGNAIKENRKEILVGDMDSVRDFTDVRDVVRAYTILLENGKSGETYNICTGRRTTIREILEEALKVTGAQMSFRVDPALLRPEGSTHRYGSAAKLKNTGWEPQFTMQQSIRDMWEYMKIFPE